MNPPPAASPSPSLDTATLAVMVRATADAIPYHPDAPAEEQAAACKTAFDAISLLRPRNVLEAMLAARIVALQFQIMDNMRCAAQHDMPPALKLRFRASAAALTRLVAAERRELTRCQALPAPQPAVLPVAVPAPRPRIAPVAAAAPRQAAGGFVPPTEAEMAQLVANVMASEDARSAAAKGRHAAAVAADPADDDDFMEPTADMAERLQAEVAARAAAAAMKLAA